MPKIDDVAPLRYQAPGIRSNKKRGEMNWREWTPAIDQFQRLKRKASWSQDELTIELGDGNRPVALAGLSDTHIGAWSSDHGLFETISDQFLKIPGLYMALLSDLGHYAIRLRGVLEVSDNLLPPELQTEFIDSWLSEMHRKIAFCTWDNHAVQRQETQAGESSYKRLMSRRVPYFNGIGHLTLKVGKQTYFGAVSHLFRGRSMLNPIHSMQRYMRFEANDREWAMAGDSHVPGLGKWTDGAMVRAAVNMGSTQLNSGYAKRFFSLKTHPVFPLLMFWPDRHEITPVWSVSEYLALRKHS